MPRLCELYPGICLTTEEKARKNLSQGSRIMPVGTMKTEYTWNINCVGKMKTSWTLQHITAYIYTQLRSKLLSPYSQEKSVSSYYPADGGKCFLQNYFNIVFIFHFIVIQIVQNYFWYNCLILTHWGRVTQIFVFTLQLCKTDDANLRF